MTASSANCYNALEYPIELHRRNDEGERYWVAEIPDLPGCVADGETPDEAVESLKEAKQLWIEARLESGHHIPEPTNPHGYSGRLRSVCPSRYIESSPPSPGAKVRASIRTW